MAGKRKRNTVSTSYKERLQGWIHKYVAQKKINPNEIDLLDVADWAIKKGLWEPRPVDVRKQLARDLAKAAAQEYIENENGKPVRRIHNYKEKRGDEQHTFWFMIEDGTPQQMKLSAGARRRGILSDCLQLDRDVKYYNKHHNPGDEIQQTFNFDPDVQEDSMPTEYPDAPPEGDAT